MKKTKTILFGILLIAFGVIISLNMLGITNIDIFFDGWWTLFIIVPSIFALFDKGAQLGGIFGLIVGVLLLLSANDIVETDILWKLLLPVALILIGIKVIFTALIKKNTHKNTSAVFSSQNPEWNDEVFNGGEFVAVFGDVKVLLNDAIIEKDVNIKMVSVFGSGFITLPPDVNVVLTSSAFCGEVKNSRSSETAAFARTVTIDAVCVFGEIKIK